MTHLKVVCKQCGSKKVQNKAWVWSNTNRFAEDIENLDELDKWCTKCEEHTEQVQSWF